MAAETRISLKLSKMDYVINTLPLTEKTESLFDEKIF